MSNMLEQAIIDAESLKEAARQSAEEKIVEHFSKDIKEAVDMILEQEDLMAMGDMEMPEEEAPMAPPTVDMQADKNKKGNGEFVVDQLPYAATTDKGAFVSIDLDKLEETMRRELEEQDMESDHLEEEYDISSLEEDLLDEDEEILDEEILDEEEEIVAEELSPDLTEVIKSILAEEMEDVIFEQDESEENESEEDESEEDDSEEAGDLQESSEEMYEAYQAYEESLQLQQEGRLLKTKNKSLITEQKNLSNKVQLLEQKLQKYGTVIDKLKDKLNETNLANAKLLYQNRILDSDSLNERQKDRIVETIMDAKTVEEAKIIYETLQSAVGANSFKRKPKSLNEVVTKRSSAFMPRKEEKRVDPFTARMKALAGIKE